MSLSAPAAAAEVAVPSGLEVAFVEHVQDRSSLGLISHFRFVAPDLAKVADFDTTVGDMQHLCDAFALPRVSGLGPKPAQIVINLQNAPSEFGVARPDLTQYFEAFSVQDGTCIWEVF